jgi:hypothetical protein
MGLIYPRDLRDWQSWQNSQRPLRSIRGKLLGDRSKVVLAMGSSRPDLVIAVEAAHHSVTQATFTPLAFLPRERIALVLPEGCRHWVNEADGWRGAEIPLTELDEQLREAVRAPRAVLAAGHYTPIGREVYRWSVTYDIPYFVAQHGLLTPYAAPLPPAATLLAWSAADASYWWGDRQDAATHVVGSQLLWTAAHQPVTQRTEDLVYLGQLHAAEINHGDLVDAAIEFCLRTSAKYRGHPNESDQRSRRAHEELQHRGVRFETSGQPLFSLGAPVVSVFSTGVLEAATKGLAAYVDYPQPPEWLLDFWRRYDLRPYDSGVSTPPPAQPSVQPAQRIAEIFSSVS